jgi:hypothetical protein
MADADDYDDYADPVPSVTSFDRVIEALVELRDVFHVRNVERDLAWRTKLCHLHTLLYNKDPAFMPGGERHPRANSGSRTHVERNCPARNRCAMRPRPGRFLFGRGIAPEIHNAPRLQNADKRRAQRGRLCAA